MTNYRRGDIVLVDFGFSEENKSKKRPALILSSEEYHRNRQEIIIAAITSNIQRILFGDTKIVEWKKAGLLYASLATGIVRTIKESMIIRKLGVLSQQDLQNVGNNIKKAIG